MKVVYAGLAVVALLIAVALIARRRFESSIDERITAIASAEASPASDSIELPPLLQSYVDRTGVVPGEGYRATRIRQVGQIKLGQQQAWQDFTADQWFAAGRPAFVWKPVMAMPVGSVRGVDRLDSDGGRLEMRLLGAIPVVNEGGPQILKAQLLRYLAELAWVPPAFGRNDALDFEQSDDRTVRVTAEMAGEAATIDLQFDEEGDIRRAYTDDRPWEEDGDYVPRSWGGTFDDYREFDGVRIPTRVEVFWDLPEGRYTYFRCEVTEFRTL